MSSISVTLNVCGDEEGDLSFALKLQGPDWELNLWMTEHDLMLVNSVRTARWSERGSIKIGKFAGTSALWSCEDGKVSILVGSDDECWDLGIWMPEQVIDEIMAEIERERQYLTRVN
jgi:hypothetical protein